MSVVIRSFEQDDLEDLIEIFDTVWGWELETEQVQKQWLATYYITTALCHADFVRVAAVQGKIAGVVCGKARALAGASPALQQNRQTYAIVAEQCRANLQSTPDGQAVLDFYARIDAINARLEKNMLAQQMDWHSEMLLLLVSPAFQSQGIGRALMHDFLHALAELDEHWCILKTDTHCNWKFYEKTGWSIAAQLDWPAQDNMTAFAFRQRIGRAG